MQTSRLRLSRAKVDTLGAEVGGARLLRCAAKNFGLPRDLEADEAGGFYKGLKLCFQQSAGDSTSPEVDVSLGAFRDRFINQDIGYL